MQLINSDRKKTGFIWVLMLALLVLLPLAWLTQLLRELRSKDESYLDLQARERLLYEMASFQERLHPEVHIENAVDALKQEFGLIDQSSSRLQPTKGIDPKMITSAFPASASVFFKERFGMLPFMVIAGECDLQAIHSWYANSPFSNKAEQKRFETAAAYWTAYAGGEIVNELPSTTNMIQLKEDFIGGKDGVASETLHVIFTRLFNQHISMFTTANTTPDSCRAFFSNLYGSQRSYHIFHRITRYHGHLKSMLGGFFLLFHSSDISPTQVLKHALTHEDNEIERYYVGCSIDQPKFSYSPTHLQYTAGFPSYFHTLVEDYAIKNPATSEVLRRFIDSTSLLIQIDRKHLASPYAIAEKICVSVSRFMLLFFFALLVRSRMQDLEKGLKLSRKLRIAVAITVMLPVTGVFLTSEQTRIGSERLALIRYQTKIRQRMDFFEKLVEETDARLIIMLQEHRRLIADAYFGASHKRLLNQIKNGHFLRYRTASIEASLDRSGKRFKRAWGKNRSSDTTTTTGVMKILSDLGFVDANSKEIKKLQKHQFLIGGLAGALINLFSNPDDLAHEGLLTKHILSASALDRSSHHLIAHPKTPLHPIGLVVFLIDDPNIMQELLKMLNYTVLQLFSDYDENCQIDYALTIRSASNLRDTMAPMGTRLSADFKRLAIKAIYRQSSNNSIKRIQNGLQIDSCYYSGISPVMILASARLKNIAGQNLLFSVVPWALLLYAILAIILISDILADIFLAPVKALLAFVRQITTGNLQTSLKISSGDEFAELSIAFNRMSEGLRQREKMRRFVSDSLYTSIEKAGDNTKAGKTRLSVISSDIRDFTTLSEQHPPEEIVSLLNDYISCMEEAITKYDGAIEKIVGDAITAAFYPKAETDAPAQRACMAALAMKKRLLEFNQQRDNADKFTIKNGIGIASGRAVMGFAAGKTGRREFVLIGDVMHRAESLEAKTKNARGSGIFIDDKTSESCGMKVEIVLSQDGTQNLELYDG